MAISFRTNAGNLAANKRVLAGKVSENMRRAAQTQAAKLKFVAQSLSSGNVSTAQLRQMGHPYSRRLGVDSGPAPDYIINRQSGLLAASWVCRAQKNRNDWTVSLWNTAPQAVYLAFGTKTSRARPIMEEVMRRTSPLLPVGVKAVMRQAVSDNGKGAPMSGSALGGLLYAVSVGVSSAASAVEDAF